MKKTRFSVFAAALCAAALLTSCANPHYTPEGGEITTRPLSEVTAVTKLETASVTAVTEAPLVISEPERTLTDREGNTVIIPDRIDTIISAAPGVSEILSGLGLADRIIAADINSAGVEGVDPSVCTLVPDRLNAEALITLEPDVVIINGVSASGGSDPYKSLKDAGVNVIYIPVSSSSASVKLDIEFLAAYTGTTEKGEALISSIDKAVQDIFEKSAEITEKKKVYFETGAAPELRACGSGTLIDEMITLCGGENIYAGETGFISNSDETVIAGDPDVIITNVMYDGYDYAEISSREGWDAIKAVRDGAVCYVDANITERASQNIVKGFYAVAEAIYPEIFAK